MADSSLEIKIRALVEGLRDLENLNEEIGNTSDSSGELQENLNPLPDSMDRLGKQVKILIASFIALAGVMSLKEAADTAARTETLGVTLGVVAANAGYTADQIAQYEAELKKLGITTQGTREALTQLIQAGIDLSAVNAEGVSRAAELARASQDLAVVTGENSSETLQRLITNIRQMDSMGLRYMGLTVDIQGAQERFAASIGKTSGALTTQQKQLAVMNAAMEEATSMQGAYEASMETVGKQMSSMSRYQEEAANAIGRSLLPAYKELVQSATELMKNMEAIASKVEETSNFAKTFGDGVGSSANALEKTITSLMELTASLAPAFGQLVQAAGDLVALIGEVTVGLIDATTESGILSEVIKTAALLVAGLTDGIRLIGAAVSLISSGWTGMLGILTRGIAQIVGLLDNEMAASINKVADGLMDMSDRSRASYSAVIKDFENGNTAVQKFIRTQEAANTAVEDFGKATSYDGVIEEIRKLTEAQRVGSMNSVEAVAAANAITASIAEMGEAHTFTEQQVARLNQRVATSLKGVRESYMAAMKDLKVALLTVGGEDLFVPISDEVNKVAGALAVLAENGEATAEQFNQAFARGLDTAKTIADLEGLSSSLEGANARAFEVGESVAAARAKFVELFDTSVAAAKTQADLDVLTYHLNQLEKQGVITSDQLVASLGRVGEQAQLIALNLQNADLLAPLKALGLTIETLDSGLSAAGQKGVEAIQNVINALNDADSAAKLTQTQLFEVFNKGFGEAKTLADLNAIRAEMERAKEAGILFGDAYQGALSESARKFNELFQAQLKSADTKVEMDALVAVVKELGASGAISGQQMAAALEDIQKKADSAKMSVLDLAKQSADAAQQSLTTMRASAAVNTASLNQQKEMRRLQELVTVAQKEGTKESRAALEYQRQRVRQSNAELQAAQAKYRYELAQMDALIAKHRQLAAEKRAAANPEDEGAMALARAAEAEAEQRQIVVERSREAVAEKEKLVVATQRAVEAAKAYAEQLGVAVDNASEAAAVVSGGGVVTPAPSRRYTSGGGSSRAPTEKPEAPEFGPRVNVFQREAIMEGYLKRLKQWQDATAPEREAAKVQKLRDAYGETADRAQAIADGLIKAGDSAAMFSRRGTEMQLAMREIQRSSLQTSKSALDGAQSFLSSQQSLKQELMSAMGMEDEAAQMRFQQRRKELDLEHQMLRLKLQSAITTARAAGTNTGELSRMLSEADRAYRESVSHLSQLEAIEYERREKAKAEAAEQKRAQEESVEAEIEGIQAVGEERAKVREAEAKANNLSSWMGGLNAQLESGLPRRQSAEALQSIAKDSTVTKVVEHKFTDDRGNTVTAQVKEDESERLINLLNEFRRRT